MLPRQILWRQTKLIHNNWKRAINLNEELKSVTAKDVSAAFNKYLTNFTWVYQGDPVKVNSKLYTQTTVTEKLPHARYEQ